MIHKLQSRDDQTIIAQATPQGSGALAIIRLSGNDACCIVGAIGVLASRKSITQVESHTIHFGAIQDTSGNTIDQVMFSIMRAPRTFTGQDTVEITCHNNQYIVEAILDAAIAQGARPAQEGEFSQRAFFNGKLDLLEAEAINELIHAQTQQALKKSLCQLEGSFSRWVRECEEELLRALSWCEASFEFLDEEEEFGTRIHEHLIKIRTRVHDLKKTFDLHQQIRQGIRIAFIGSVNAGKSSLFNNLIGHNRSIVSQFPGTTRDTVEATISVRGSSWTLIDTAGIRQTKDVIEQEGVQRSLSEAQKADCILLVFDGSRPLTVEERILYTSLIDKYPHKCILVQNKADLAEYKQDPFTTLAAIKVSGIQKKDAELIEKHIEQCVLKLFKESQELPFLLNARHHRVLSALDEQLKIICDLLSGTIHYELVSVHLKNALEISTELTGKSISEAALDTVFKEFCVGK